MGAERNAGQGFYRGHRASSKGAGERGQAVLPGMFICSGLTKSGCCSGFPAYTNHSFTAGKESAPSEQTQTDRSVEWQ